MVGLEIVSASDQDVAFIVRSSFSAAPGIQFFTDSFDNCQLGAMKRSAGHEVARHFHFHERREVDGVFEALIVRSGRVLVQFFALDREFIGEKTLVAGDICLIQRGGHSVRFLEDSEVLELKQGPYLGSLDKFKF